MIQTVQVQELVCDICGEHEVLLDGVWVRACSVCECEMCGECLSQAERRDSGWVCAGCVKAGD